MIYYRIRKKRFKKLFVKGRERKHKGDGRPLSSGSDDEGSPEHDQNTVKVNKWTHRIINGYILVIYWTNNVYNGWMKY